VFIVSKEIEFSRPELQLLEGFYGGGFSGILKGAECRQVVSGHLKTYANIRLDLIDNKAT